jgi:hypothetical protein
MAQQPEEHDGATLEHGHIYFFYRPRVTAPGEEPRPHGLEDIARAYVVLHPKDKGLYRLLVLPRKRLPDIAKREREWAFVEMVSRKSSDIERQLRSEVYGTKTRGARVVPAARPAGEGVYSLVRHADHTHLAYALELPEQPGPVQRALEIQREASYIVSVKSPEAPLRFLPADPPALLDYPGAQLLLIGASANVRAELGIELDPEKEDERTAEIFRDLHLSKAQHPIDPLIKGEWR